MSSPPDAAPDFLFNGSNRAKRVIVLAHGAGAGRATPFMSAFAEGLAHGGLRVARFEFPYMVDSGATGKKRPPDRESVLRKTWLRVIDRLGPENLIIGGKSMGGRIASLVADSAGVAGLACLGYPFHPTGQPDRLRVEHLRTIRTSTLILQGSRDAFGDRTEVAGYPLSPAVKVHWLEDGNHDFTPRKTSGRTEVQNWEEAIAAIIKFVNSL